MSATWDILQIARDARLEGRADIAAQLYAEASEDVPEYVRLSAARPGWKRGTALRVFHRTFGRIAKWMDWQEEAQWASPTPLSPHLLAEMERLRRLAFESLIVPMPRRHESDAIEFRIRSYANLIVPVWNGVFAGVDL